MILNWDGEWLDFSQPIETHSISPGPAWDRSLKRVGEAALEGFWVGGYLRYPGIYSEDRPGLYFEVHRSPQPYTLPDAVNVSGPWLTPWVSNWSREEYSEAFQAVKKSLVAGDSYQMNLTMELTTYLLGKEPGARITDQDWVDLWERVASRGQNRHGGIILHGNTAVLSWSPESWVKARPGEKGMWNFECNPMKGTALRSSDPLIDKMSAQELAGSEKNRAENLMITDMVRHELGELVYPGQVETPELFQVMTLPTLHQMTSTVTASGFFEKHPFPQLVSSLFPPASITGAPKKRTQELLQTMEKRNRGIYTGVIFLLAPGGAMESGVAIRTLEAERKTGKAVFGVGGGIVYDSQVQTEYDEAYSKALFLAPHSADWNILETMLWEPESGVRLWAGHMERMEKAARFFRRDFHEPGAREVLEELVAKYNEGKALRVRLLLGPTGIFQVEAKIFQPFSQILKVRLADGPIQGEEPLRHFKTDRRKVYEDFAPGPGEEIFLYDTEGFLLEGTFTNLALRFGDQWLTPGASRVFLPGVYRDLLLKQGKIMEADLPYESFYKADEIACFNALRGWIPAKRLSAF